MSNFLDIKQGGRIRYNFVAAAGQTWLRGQVLCLNQTNDPPQLQLVSAANIGASVFFGLALEQCVAVSTGNVIQNTNVVVAGMIASVLAGEAVVVNDNVSGTGNWVAGVSRVYGDANGNLTYTKPDPSINQSGLGLGVCLRSPVSDGKLKFLFRPPV